MAAARNPDRRAVEGGTRVGAFSKSSSGDPGGLEAVGAGGGTFGAGGACAGAGLGITFGCTRPPWSRRRSFRRRRRLHRDKRSESHSDAPDDLEPVTLLPVPAAVVSGSSGNLILILRLRWCRSGTGRQNIDVSWVVLVKLIARSCAARCPALCRRTRLGRVNRAGNRCPGSWRFALSTCDDLHSGSVSLRVAAFYDFCRSNVTCTPPWP